tara:strand:+ start:544 stop:915 length:372 start_codon:yes stop_codon:yes gene_type:complete
MNIRASIIEKSDEIKELLLNKNSAYGNSALQPGGIFSRLDRIEALKARIDDKLNRIKNVGVHGETEDTVMDLAGYLILLMIALDNESNNLPEHKGHEESTSHNDTHSASTYTGGKVRVTYSED